MKPLIVEFRILFWAILAVIVPFGLLLLFLPNKSELYWAWIILHPRSAILIGAGYVGAIAYYAMALKENDWSQAENGMGGLIVFCLALLFATLAHWESFRPYHITTLVWLMFYYVGPVLVPILARLQTSGPKTATERGTNLASMWRVWLIARGMFYLALALGGIVLAHRVSELWPWSMRPLELRVFMGQVAIIGWNGAIAISGGLLWQHHRLGLVLTGAIGFVQIIGLFINPTPYDWSSPLGILLPLMFAEWLITALVIWALYERR